jgi:hypothetical protein
MYKGLFSRKKSGAREALPWRGFGRAEALWNGHFEALGGGGGGAFSKSLPYVLELLLTKISFVVKIKETLNQSEDATGRASGCAVGLLRLWRRNVPWGRFSEPGAPL